MIYVQLNGGSAVPEEYAIDGGSGRIGTFYKQDNVYAYELRDQLGNVRATIAQSGTTLEVRGYSDYYPYGMVLRSGGTTYRYGYQGAYAEKDGETDWNAFELRMYDSRIARWMTTDPAGQFASPYIAMGGDPVNNVDKNGGESGPGDPPTKCNGCTLNDVYVTASAPKPVNINRMDGPPIMINTWQQSLVKTQIQAPPTIQQASPNADYWNNYWSIQRMQSGAIMDPVAAQAAGPLSLTFASTAQGIESDLHGIYQGAFDGNGWKVAGYTGLLAFDVMPMSGGEVSEGYHSFTAFKRAYGAAGEGLAWHHIVEQTSGNIERFGSEAIHNADNLIRLDHGAGSIHAKVSGYYSSIQPFTNGQTVRQWLSTQSFQAQYDFGIQTLKNFGWTPR